MNSFSLVHRRVKSDLVASSDARRPQARFLNDRFTFEQLVSEGQIHNPSPITELPLSSVCNTASSPDPARRIHHNPNTPCIIQREIEHLEANLDRAKTANGKCEKEADRCSNADRLKAHLWDTVHAMFQDTLDDEIIKHTETALANFNYLAELVSTPGLARDFFLRASDALRDDRSVEEELIEFIKAATQDLASPWATLIPAITGPRTPAQYVAAVNLSVTARKDARKWRKVAKFWKGTAHSAGGVSVADVVTPSPSDISDVHVILSESHRDVASVDDVLEHSRDVESTLCTDSKGNIVNPGMKVESALIGRSILAKIDINTHSSLNKTLERIAGGSLAHSSDITSRTETKSPPTGVRPRSFKQPHVDVLRNTGKTNGISSKENTLPKNARKRPSPASKHRKPGPSSHLPPDMLLEAATQNSLHDSNAVCNKSPLQVGECQLDPDELFSNFIASSSSSHSIASSSYSSDQNAPVVSSGSAASSNCNTRSILSKGTTSMRTRSKLPTLKCLPRSAMQAQTPPTTSLSPLRSALPLASPASSNKTTDGCYASSTISSARKATVVNQVGAKPLSSVFVTGAETPPSHVNARSPSRLRVPRNRLNPTVFTAFGGSVVGVKKNLSCADV